MNRVIILVKAFPEEVILSCISQGFIKALTTDEYDFVEYDIFDISRPEVVFKFSVEDNDKDVEIVISGFGKALITLTICKHHLEGLDKGNYVKVLKNIASYLIGAIKVFAKMSLVTKVEIDTICSCCLCS